jgi:hypothetical protein
MAWRFRCNDAQEFILVLYVIFLYTTRADSSNLNQPGYVVDQDLNIEAASVHNFLTSVQNVLLAISSGWRNTGILPQVVVSFLIASDTMPTRDQFERFIGSNKYFDPNNAIKWTTWNQHITNNERKSFEDQIRRNYPEFQMFRYAPNGSKLSIPPNASQDYSPITYCTPRSDDLIGFDIYNDPVEGAAIRSAGATGRPTSIAPFLLHGLPPDTQFRIAPFFKSR